MSFEEFIVKYYGWVLAILLILIVTIIGFIADKKMKKKKEGNLMNEQNMQNNQFMGNPNSVNPIMSNPSDVNSMTNLNTTNASMEPNMGQQMAMPSMDAFNNTSMQMPNNIPPVTPTDVTVNSNSAINSNNDFNYTPLSEQTPNIPSRFEGMPTVEPQTQTNMATPAINNGYQEMVTPVQPISNMENVNIVPNTVTMPNVNPSMTMPNINENMQYSATNVGTVATPVTEPIQSINPQPISLNEQPVVNNGPIPVMSAPTVNQPINPVTEPQQQPVNMNPNSAVDVNNMFVTSNQMPNTNNPINTNPWQ